MQQLRQVLYTDIPISYPMSYMISYSIFDIPISYTISYLISFAISYTICLRAELVPPLDKEAAGFITSSEAILKDFASKHSLNASTINDLIKDVLKNRLSIRMKLIPTFCSDFKPPSTGVTFRL